LGADEFLAGLDADHGELCAVAGGLGAGSPAPLGGALSVRYSQIIIHERGERGNPGASAPANVGVEPVGFSHFCIDKPGAFLLK